MAHEKIQPLDPGESRKRRREGVLIVFLALLFVGLTFLEFRLTRVSATLPFSVSIFFFGLLNVNIILLIALVWLVFRNIGKLFIERRRQILGAKLKTKLVIAFFSFSIIPTLVLFIISALYINSSFDKWFSLKIQNTLQASLEVTSTYYTNTEHTAMHFAEHLAQGIGRRMPPASLDDETWAAASPAWIQPYLEEQRELLALDAVEFYPDPLEARVFSQRGPLSDLAAGYPRLPLDLLDKAFQGEHLPVLQHVGTGDLIRTMAPVHARASVGQPIVGVVVVNAYIPVSLVNKVDEIASVFDDYKFTNPLKAPMKTTYLVILIMITLVIVFVAIWVGLYMARELTIPLARLVHGAQAVGAGNLNVTIPAVGHDEIGILIESFNKMTKDLRDKQESLTQAGADLEKRRLQLEAVLANIGTGVMSVAGNGEITTFNRALSKLVGIEPEDAVGKPYATLLRERALPLVELVERAFRSSLAQRGFAQPEVTQWNLGSGESYRALAAVATPLSTGTAEWGVVAVVDDMTHLIKGQREMAWREVARRIAHEIKNPLTPIKLSAQRLQRRLAGTPGEDGELLKECTDTIIKHTDELKEMVNEFSNFARFPEANPVPHELNPAVSEVIGLFQQAHPMIEFKVALKPVPVFDFDRDQIKRVMINLLDNAVAALGGAEGTGAAGPRRIDIETSFNDELRMATIRVSDTGPGMAGDVLERVFEPYFSTKTEGTGLGLAIAKRIVNDHDGFIRVHSTPGQGTEFVIELPASERAKVR